MKIIGIGNDIVDIRRIESLVTKYGSRFTNRVFTEIEQKRSSMLSDSYSSYAKNTQNSISYPGCLMGNIAIALSLVLLHIG